ncbi:hypothetical protein ACJMK2_029330, partial [Sinanodonta woodiana]
VSGGVSFIISPINMSGSSHMAKALINVYMNLCQRMKRGHNLGLITRRMSKS